MQDVNEPKYVLYYRVFFCLLSGIAISLSLYDGTVNPLWITGAGWAADFFGGFAYFTIQSNIMVFSWWLLAIIRRNNPDSLQKIMGKIRGGITMYISVTFAVFALVLGWYYEPGTTIAVFTNICLHYFLPSVFILDWFLTEKNRYSWNFIKNWIIFPIFYLIFALIYGATTGIILYFFLDYNEFGVGLFALIILGLVLVFLAFSCILIAITMKRNKISNKLL
jgi:hypothetical protein